MFSKVIVSSLVLVSLFNFVYWSIRPELDVGWREYLQYPQFQPSSDTMDTDMKTVLVWTDWYGSQVEFIWEGHSDLRNFGCDQESYKCTITSNRSYLTDERLYDGFLFSERNINQLDIPDQGKRGANQVYMFQSVEAPINSLSLASSSIFSDPIINSNFFNVTMTYTYQSEIHTPFGKIVKVASHPSGEKLDLYIARFGERNARHMPPKTPERFFALILLTNCASRSQREKMVAELGLVVPVDVFGACGVPFDGGYDGTTEGIRIFSEKYHFYLSFENALCDDYVTERFFAILHSNVIPVVMNGANMSRIAPKHSYIDVKDFASITDLGNYLKKVSSDPALYASYFWWRQHYEVEFAANRIRLVKFLCEACHYLHSGKGPSIVEDLKKEWVDGSQCRERPNISYIDEEDTAA